MSPSPPKPAGAPAFDISPEVVFRLGDELITDELQALVELVKNSYDASATRAVVQIDTKVKTRLTIPPELADERFLTQLGSSSRPDSPRHTANRKDAERPPSRNKQTKSVPALGWLEVHDNGDGMTRDRLDRGWLLISSSAKRTAKDAGKTNRLGRTPLGDKGLGRLGVLRLGLRIEIRTRPRERPEEHILRFSRGDFQREQALSQIHPHYEVRRLKKVGASWQPEVPFEDDVSCSAMSERQGTVIRITGLISPGIWTDKGEVQTQMLSLISPFREIDDFDVRIHIDEPVNAEPLPLGQLADLRRNLADVRWSFDFDGEEMKLTGRLKLRAFEPRQTNVDLSSLWKTRIEPDGGAEYRRRLTDGRLRGVRPRAEAPPYWLRVTQTVHLAELTGGKPTRKKDESRARPNWVSPGPFYGELDSFDLDRNADLSVDGQDIFKGVEPYRAWVRQVRGLRVYRDGFGVRVGEDFLRLGAGFTGGRSFYALRPGNVVGFVAISARHNQQLQETTDREGFVSNAPYRAFEALLRWAVERINFVQTEIGRELRTWADSATFPQEPKPSKTAEELAAVVSARAGRNAEALAEVEAAQRTLREVGGGGALLTPEQEQGARQTSEILARLRELAAEWETLDKDLQSLAQESRRIEREREELRDQLRAAYQTVGLGIVAETVAHEMENTIGRLLAEANALGQGLQGPEHRAARALVGEVKRTVRDVRLQLRHLDPQLRYQRARRELVDLGKLVKDVAAFHGRRYGDDNISIGVTGTPFTVRVNRGRIQQALDNLFINSHFWLTHADVSKPGVELSMKSPHLTFRDNGPGVDPALEPVIFEPFVSGRTGEQGRGLGLFITRQVLRDDHANIYLGPEDSDGLRRTFVIDLAGAIPEPE